MRRLRLYHSIPLNDDLMKTAKKARLEKAGFRIGSAAEFLKLTPADIALDNAISTAAARNRAKGTALVLSKAEIARIDRAQENIKPLLFHPRRLAACHQTGTDD